jgi:DNA-binding LytR/AlgR family response regulator
MRSTPGKWEPDVRGVDSSEAHDRVTALEPFSLHVQSFAEETTAPWGTTTRTVHSRISNAAHTDRNASLDIRDSRSFFACAKSARDPLVCLRSILLTTSSDRYVEVLTDIRSLEVMTAAEL